MAQQSKKDHIIASARPLFLLHGFKGTSIDLVVKASKVSKPTVYNHFPDKATLFIDVLKTWIDARLAKIPVISATSKLEKIIQDDWLTDETVRFYALIIGEGCRIPEAKELFWATFDASWRRAILIPGRFDDAYLESTMNRELLNHLKNLQDFKISL